MTTNASTRARPVKRIPSDRELMELPNDGYKRELLHGKIVITPAGSEHGQNIIQFAVVFAGFVLQHRLGRVFDGQTGFRMKSRDVLSPDISFVTRARLQRIGGTPKGFFEGAPDLAIEFLSPRESKKHVKEKLAQYFENGTQLAWVMDAKRGTVAVHHGAEPDRILEGSDEIRGESLVPGFRIVVATVFAGTE